jgi:hypothetical protein
MKLFAILPHRSKIDDRIHNESGNLGPPKKDQRELQLCQKWNGLADGNPNKNEAVLSPLFNASVAYRWTPQTHKVCTSLLVNLTINQLQSKRLMLTTIVFSKSRLLVRPSISLSVLGEQKSGTAIGCVSLGHNVKWPHEEWPHHKWSQR